jgi:hypothetical protein
MMRMRVLRQRGCGSQSGQGGEEVAACGHGSSCCSLCIYADNTRAIGTTSSDGIVVRPI